MCFSVEDMQLEACTKSEQHARVALASGARALFKRATCKQSKDMRAPNDKEAQSVAADATNSFVTLLAVDLLRISDQTLTECKRNELNAQAITPFLQQQLKNLAQLVQYDTPKIVIPHTLQNLL